MKDSLHDLIGSSEPEPWLLNALHIAKVILVLVGFMSFVIFSFGPILGFGSNIWLYAFFALLVAAILAAVLANRRSESLFARRAERLGLDGSEARRFWRSHDWEQDDNA